MAFDANLKGLYLIGEYNGEPVAANTLINVVDDLEYGSYLYIVEEFRKKGLAERLLDFVIRHCSQGSILSIDSIDQMEQSAVRDGFQICVPIRCFVGQVPVQWTLKVQQNTVQVKEKLSISIS